MLRDRAYSLLQFWRPVFLNFDLNLLLKDAMSEIGFETWIFVFICLNSYKNTIPTRNILKCLQKYFVLLIEVQ